MKQFGELFQAADWKTEKHVPAIECPDQVKVDQLFSVKVTLGKEVAHPNTTKINKPGVIYASSLCNIHGLWQSNKEIKTA